MSELVIVLVLPLSHGIHKFVMYILSINNEIVLYMEDEVPWVSERLCHSTKFIEIGADGSLALFKVIRDVVNDSTKVLYGVQDSVEGGVLELINYSAESLPSVLGIAEALDSVGHFGLDGAGKQTLEDLAHSEEGEMHIRTTHGLEAVQFLVLLNINLIKKLLPVVVEIKEELFVVDHLGLSVKKHGSSLTEMLAAVKEVAHSVVMEALTDILENVDSVDDDALSSLKKELFWMEESLSHSLNLFIIVMVNLSAMVKHISNIRNSKTKLINSFSDLLVASVPEASHGIFEVFLHWISVRDAVGNVSHAMEVESSNEESLNKRSNLFIVVGVISLG